jgi:hypothetical protein
LVRRYSILAAILLGLRRSRRSIAGTGDAAQPAPPLEPTWADVSTIPSRSLRRWYASRPPTVLAKHVGRFRQDCAGRCSHWEMYCEYPYSTAELFAPFSAAQGASSLRVRASQTSIATLSAREISARCGCDVVASSYLLLQHAWLVRRPRTSSGACLFRWRTHTNEGTRMRTVERMTPGLAEAARPL